MGVSGAAFAAGIHRGVGVDFDLTANLGDPQIELRAHGLNAFAVHQAAMDRLVKDLVRRAEVFADLVGLADDVREEGQVLVLVGDEVEDGDVAGLAMPVETTVALLDARRVPGAVEVQQVAGGALQVEALGCSVGGDEHAHRVERVVEAVLHVAALDVVHSAEERQHAIGSVPRAQTSHKIVQRGLVLGEDDDPLVLAPAVRSSQEPFDQLNQSVVTRVDDGVDLGQVSGSTVEAKRGDGFVNSRDLGPQKRDQALQPQAPTTLAAVATRVWVSRSSPVSASTLRRTT